MTVTFEPGSEVPEIPKWTFAWFSSLQVIQIPLSVSVLHEGCFHRCTSLQRVELGNNACLSSIEKDAFSGCSCLRNIEIPNKVTHIGVNCFSECSSLANVRFESECKLTSIERGAFQGCVSLVEIEIPASVESIGEYSFSACVRLQYPRFQSGSNLKSIGMYAFHECKSLKEVEIPVSIETLCERCFYGCTSLKELRLENCSSLTRIESNAFSKTGIIDIEIPANVETIVGNIFPKTIEKVISKSTKHFEKVNNMIVSHIEEGGKQLSKLLTSFSVSSIQIPKNIDVIGECCFCDSECIKEVRFEAQSSVTCIKSGAFHSCSTLEIIVLPSGLKSIENAAFRNCKKLATVECEPNSQLKSIGNQAFVRCASLTIINLPAGLETIGDFAFADSGLREFTIPESVTILGHSLFKGSLLERIEFNEKLESIPAYGFWNCKRLSAIVLPANIRIIGIEAFRECVSLETVDFAKGSKLEVVKRYAFEGCNIKSCNFPKSTKILEKNCFRGNKELKEVSFPGLEEMGLGCFSLCESLTKVVIPSKVKTLPRGAFNECSGLREISFENNSCLCEIIRGAFTGTALTEIEIPGSVKVVKLNECKHLTRVIFKEGKDPMKLPRDVLQGSDQVDYVEISRDVEHLGCIMYGKDVNKRFIFKRSSPYSADGFIVPRSVCYIGESCFSGCRNIRHISFEEGSCVEILLEKCFSNCHDLICIDFRNATRLRRIHSDVFGQNVGFVWDSNENVWKCGKVSMKFSSRMNVLDGVLTSVVEAVDCSSSTVFDSTMVDYDSCDEINIPLHTAKVCDFAMWKLNTKRVTFEVGSVCTDLGNCTFEKSDLSGGIVLREGLLRIGASCFEGSKLGSIEVPSSVEFLGERAFSQCRELRRVTFHDDSNIRIVPDECFYGCRKLTKGLDNKNLRIEDILEAAFALSGLKTVIIPDYTLYIRLAAFAYCSRLENVICGTNLDDIGNRAFFGCMNLTEVNFSLSRNLVYIGAYAFSGMNKLRKVVLPGSVKTIECGCFSGCPLLRVIEFEPSSEPVLLCYGCFAYTIIKLIDFSNRNVKVGRNANFKDKPFENRSPFMCSRIHEVRMSICSPVYAPLLFDGTSIVDCVVVEQSSSAAKYLKSLGINVQLSNRVQEISSWRMPYLTGNVDLSRCTGLLGVGDCAYLDQFNITRIDLPKSAVIFGVSSLLGCKYLHGVRYSKKEYVDIAGGRYAGSNFGINDDLRGSIVESLAEDPIVKEVRSFRAYWKCRLLKEEDWDHIDEQCLPEYLLDWNSEEQAKERSRAFDKVVKIMEDNKLM